MASVEIKQRSGGSGGWAFEVVTGDVTGRISVMVCDDTDTPSGVAFKLDPRGMRKLIAALTIAVEASG